MEKMSMSKLRKMIGVSYLGGITKSAKMQYSYNNGTVIWQKTSPVWYLLQTSLMQSV